MKKISYEIMDKAEAQYAGASEDLVCDLRDELDWSGPNTGVFRCEDGVPVRLLGMDGGEPEDQTLGRDWSWIAKALDDAYKLGREGLT